MAKKIKKAILAGLAAYAGAKMMGKGLKGNINAANVENANIKAALVDAADAGTKFPPKHRIPDRIKNLPSGKQSGPKTWRDYIPWFQEGGSIKASVWKKHGGAIRTEHARMGKMIKAAQGTYAREDESLGMRLGKGKGTAKERDMSYGDWGKRKHDWAKSGKMIKARHGTEVRTMGSNPFTPKGSVVGVKTKLNGTVKTRVF